VPAAAVIPAPTVYIKVVAVKKLVVELWTRPAGPAFYLMGRVLALVCRVLPASGKRFFFFNLLSLALLL
jgi:hypothetical protein